MGKKLPDGDFFLLIYLRDGSLNGREGEVEAHAG
jgi:hypothetical protein